MISKSELMQALDNEKELDKQEQLEDVAGLLIGAFSVFDILGLLAIIINMLQGKNLTNEKGKSDEINIQAI